MKFALVAVVVLAVAVGVAECWTLPFFGDKATTYAPSINVPADPAPQPCAPTQETLSPTLEALQNRLPPQLGALVTPQNVKALENVGVLAGLATSAATGNPIAIVKLALFLTSKDNPVGPLVNMTKEIIPLMKPGAEAVGDSIKDAASDASSAIKEHFEDFQEDFQENFQDFLSFVHLKPASPVAPAAPKIIFTTDVAAGYLSSLNKYPDLSTRRPVVAPIAA